MKMILGEVKDLAFKMIYDQDFIKDMENLKEFIIRDDF